MKLVKKYYFYFIAGALVLTTFYFLGYFKYEREGTAPKIGYLEQTSMRSVKIDPQSESANTGSSVDKVAPVDVLVDGLRGRLEANPEDVEGWVLLAKSYHYLQRHEDAAEAFGRARDLGYSGANPIQDRQVTTYNKPVHNLRQSNNRFLSGYIESSILKQKTSAETTARKLSKSSSFGSTGAEGGK